MHSKDCSIHLKLDFKPAGMMIREYGKLSHQHQIVKIRNKGRMS